MKSQVPESQHHVSGLLPEYVNRKLDPLGNSIRYCFRATPLPKYFRSGLGENRGTSPGKTGQPVAYSSCTHTSLASAQPASTHYP